MLTPEIKTNLILKEIGIKRYSLRSNADQSSLKNFSFFQKGHILALLDKPYEDLIDEYKDLLRAILSSTKLDEGKEIFKTITYSSKSELNKEIMSIPKNKLAIMFGKIPNDYLPDCEYIKAPSINELSNIKNLKKDLWINIKQKLDL